MIRMEAVFLPADPGQRLCLIHRPVGTARGAVVYVPPLGEEMNKSRRQVALMAREFAVAGYAVVLPDLYGCGDSSGDFGDADWSVWLHDIEGLCRWTEEQFGHPVWLWGLRAGALLATRVAGVVANVSLLLWQPVVSGRLHLTQFLRVKIANEALAAAAGRAGTKEIYERLMAGGEDEIAGYRLSSKLARCLDAAELDLPDGYRGRVVWSEVTSATELTLTPRSAATVEAWRNRGVAVDSHVVTGLPFWQTVEISECVALIEATKSMFETVL
jgi:exosortase A-associated hydrolase 2